MKSIKSGLLTGSFIAALMLLSAISSHAQGTDKLISQERIVAVQAGTVQLVNGKLTVPLTENTLKQLAGKDAQYFVTLTPIGDCGQLKVLEKKGNQFTVQEFSQVGSNGTFDYVVSVKKTVYTGIKHEDNSK